MGSALIGLLGVAIGAVIGIGGWLLQHSQHAHDREMAREERAQARLAETYRALLIALNRGLWAADGVRPETGAASPVAEPPGDDYYHEVNALSALFASQEVSDLVSEAVRHVRDFWFHAGQHRTLEAASPLQVRSQGTAPQDERAAAIAARNAAHAVLAQVQRRMAGELKPS